MQNSKREESILSSVMNRNKNDSQNPLDRTFDKYKIDKNKLDDSTRVIDFENALADNIASKLHTTQVDNLNNNTSNEAYNEFDDNELTQFYADELRTVISDVSGMSKSMLKNQLTRMDALMHTLADADIDENDFLLEQYAKSVTFLEDEYKRKSNMMIRTQEFMGNLASDYLDVQSLYAGFVNHNPLAMGLFKMGKTALDNHRDSKKEKEQLIEADFHRHVVAEKNEERKAQLLKDEEERASELADAQKKAGVSPEDDKQTSNPINKDVPIDTGNKIPDAPLETNTDKDKSTKTKVDDAKNDVESRIRDGNLKKRQFKLIKSREKETARWQKKVLKRLRRIERGGLIGKGRGKRGGIPAVPAGLLSNLGSVGKTMLAGLAGGLSTSILAGLSGALPAIGVAVAGAVGVGIGTAVTKGYEHLRGGKGSIGTDIYDATHDDYNVESAVRKGVVDRDWIGNSEIKAEKLNELTIDELKALIKLNDFSAKDTKLIKEEMLKQTKILDERRKARRKLERDKVTEKLNSMTPTRRVMEYGFDPLVAQERDAKHFKGRSGKQDIISTISNHSVSNMANTPLSLKRGEVGGASTPEIKAFLEQIAVGEGTGGIKGYDTEFAHGQYSGGRTKKLTDMTLDEVREHQRGMINRQKAEGRDYGSRSSAIGKGQFISETFDRVRSKMGLDGNTKFTPEIQDAMMEWLWKNEGGGNKFMKGSKNGADTHKMLTSTSNVWSSVANPNTGTSSHMFRGKKQRTVNNKGNMTNVINGLANPSSPRMTDKEYSVENQGIEKVQVIEAKADIIEEKQAKANAEPIVVQQTIAKTNNIGGGGSSDSPAVRSARNSDSGIQRIADRQISQGMT